MACEFICDGCGKREAGIQYNQKWFRPRDWFERWDEEDGTQTACSRECIKKIADKTGKTSVVIPV